MKTKLTHKEHIDIMSRALDIQKYQLLIQQAELKRKVLISSADNLKDYIDPVLYMELRRLFDGEINSIQRALDWLRKNEGKSERDYYKEVIKKWIK